MIKQSSKDGYAKDDTEMRRESRNLHDAMVARLARSTLKDRVSVAFNAETSHWEISFNKLAEDDFNAISAVPVRVVPTNWDFGDRAEGGHRAIRLKNLTGSQARDFTRAVAVRFSKSKLTRL